MSPLARMFGAMISGFATGVAIAAVIVFALMMPEGQRPRRILRGAVTFIRQRAKGSSRNIRHEEAIRHALLKVPDHRILSSRY